MGISIEPYNGKNGGQREWSENSSNESEPFTQFRDSNNQYCCNEYFNEILHRRMKIKEEKPVLLYWILVDENLISWSSINIICINSLHWYPVNKRYFVENDYCLLFQFLLKFFLEFGQEHSGDVDKYDIGFAYIRCHKIFPEKDRCLYISPKNVL